MATVGTWLISAFGWLATPIGAFFRQSPPEGMYPPKYPMDRTGD